MKERVLFVDPTGQLFTTLSGFFLSHGLAVENATTREEAVQKYKHHQYSILFCRLDEIRQEDLDFLKDFAHRSAGSGAQVLVAGPNEVEFAVKAMQSGARHYWSAPVDAAQIQAYFRNGFPTIRNSSNFQKREETLLQIIKEIALTMELDGLANILIDSALELTRGDGGVLLLWNEKQRELTMKAIRGVSGIQEAPPPYFGLTQAKCQEIFISKKPVFIHTIDDSAITTSSKDRVDSLIAAPIWAKEEPLGLLAVLKFKNHEHGFASEDFQLLSRLAHEISGAVHNAFVHYKTKELTIKDDLTEAYNRRYFEGYLEDEFSRARRYHSPLSLIFFDVDNLKAVNLKHGHINGSKTLQEIAHRMILTVRGIDKVVRYGGDEFCILLPQTDSQGAFQVAERLRAIISNTPYTINDSAQVQLTGSFGIASFPTHAVTTEELIKVADRAMFAVKNKTKNGIGIADARPS